MKIPKSGSCGWPAARHGKRRWINSIVITTHRSRIMGWSHVMSGWLLMMTNWLVTLHHKQIEYSDQKLIDCSIILQAGLWENCRSLLLQLFLVSRCRVWAFQIMGQFSDPLLKGREGVLLTVVRSCTWSFRCVFSKLTFFLRRTSSLLLEYTSHIGPTSFLRGWLKIWIIIHYEYDVEY